MVNRTLFASRLPVAVDSAQEGIIATGMSLPPPGAGVELNRN